jgi:pimeloyl-ACP methyl ester carboxylesterase
MGSTRAGIKMPEAEIRQAFESTPGGGVGRPRFQGKIGLAIQIGEEKYMDIRVPVLAIFADPDDDGPYTRNDPVRAAVETSSMAIAEGQAKAIEAGIPSARVVRLPHANHAIFISNEADVLREMRAFIERLN